MSTSVLTNTEIKTCVCCGFRWSRTRTLWWRSSPAWRPTCCLQCRTSRATLRASAASTTTGNTKLKHGRRWKAYIREKNFWCLQGSGGGGRSSSWSQWTTAEFPGWVWPAVEKIHHLLWRRGAVRTACKRYESPSLSPPSFPPCLLTSPLLPAEYPELQRIKRELSLLSKLYSLYNSVIDSVAGYYDILWADLNIEKINTELQDFQNR